MTTIKVNYPYYEKTYEIDMGKEEVLRKIYDCTDYPDRTPNFETKDECGKECTIFINPNNFASVIVMDGE